MFLTWDKKLPWHQYQFVIIGSGPAGLYLAESLAARGKVLVVEAGDLAHPQSTGEGYYELLATGEKYASLGTRLSAFGGTSNHWGGNSHPLSPEVFDNRPSIAGWPIGYEDFAAHLDDGIRFLNLQPFGVPAPKSSIERGILADYDDLEVARFQYSDPVRHLGDTANVRAYRQRRDIDVLLNTRLVDIHLAPEGDRVDAIDLLFRPSRETARVRVGRLLLAAGGIENARILLWAGRKYDAGNPLLGGPNELTGTHFSDHLYASPVEIFLDRRADMIDAAPHGSSNAHLAWELSEAFRAAHGLPRFGVFPERGQIAAVDDPDLAANAGAYLQQSSEYIKLEPGFQFEQTPLPDSRVTLATTLDSDGIPRSNLHWKVLDSDYEAYRRATLLFCGLLNQNGFAKARLKPSHRYPVWTGSHLSGADHPMGTTRMGSSGLDGVVDANCRVFGLANLFIAGSSVFPAGDYVNPTLNIVALAARLASQIGTASWARFKFGLNGIDNAALIRGWSRLEPDGVWTDGRSATLVIDRPEMSEIVLSGRAFYGVRGIVSINGSRVFSGDMGEALGTPLKFAPTQTVTLRFRFANPASPKQFGESNDTRKLGVFLRGLEVR